MLIAVGGMRGDTDGVRYPLVGFEVAWRFLVRLLGWEAAIPHILRASLPAELDPCIDLLGVFCHDVGLLRGDGLG